MRKLRENQGIYFEIDVGPASPRKANDRNRLKPFSKDPFKHASKHSFSDNGAVTAS